MNRKIAGIMRSAEGRYLTSEEMNTVIETARDFERRLGIMKRLEEKEQAIVMPAVEKAFEKFPDFPKVRPMAPEKGTRDVTLVLRYCALAMAYNDAEMLKEKLLYWLKTIFVAMEFDPNFVRHTYETVKEQVAKEMSAEDAEEINQYVNIVIDVLCSEDQAAAAGGQSY